jgi:predicted nucleic acid-binding protein
MAWLPDTNILSERRKPKPEPRVTAFYDAQPLNALYISVVSIAETFFVIGKLQALADMACSHPFLSSLDMTEKIDSTEKIDPIEKIDSIVVYSQPARKRRPRDSRSIAGVIAAYEHRKTFL